MQNKPYSSQAFSPSSNSSKNLAPRLSQTPTYQNNYKPSRQPSGRDDLARVFNTALISTQTSSKRDFSAELRELTASAPFKTILNAIRQLACIQGVPERQAAEDVIRTFRKLDEVWGEYVFREGVDHLRGSKR